MKEPQSRRSMLGLIAGASVAAPAMARDIVNQANGPSAASGVARAPDYPPSPLTQTNKDPSLISPFPDDFDPWRDALNAEAERMCVALDRQIEAVCASRSTSEAYKIFTVRKLNREQQEIRQRNWSIVDAAREWFLKQAGFRK